MKLLLTLPEPLFPADTGGKIRSLNIFSRLARKTEIHAVSFADLEADKEGIEEMQRIFASYVPVAWRQVEKYSLSFYRQVVASQFSPLPYFLAKRYLPPFRAAVQKVAQQAQTDLLFCDFLHTAAPSLTVPFKPRVVFEHNVEFLLRKRKWEVEAHPVRKRVFGNEWRKTRVIEAQVCRAFDHVIAVSEEDRATLTSEFGVDRVSVLPTGVDTDFFGPGRGRSIPGRLVFVGSMDWDPNEDGMIWFLREVYPLIRQQQRDASLSIVGRSPSPRLRAVVRTQPDVELTGRVPDVRPHVSLAEVVIVPLRIGGGTRIKIPEAMAMAKAVVSTPIGAEGLPFEDGREIRLAESREDFAHAVIELLANQRLRTQLAENARKAVVSRHGWENVVARLEEVLDQVASCACTIAA